MEFRKHYSDFSAKEEKLLNTYLGNKYSLCDHATLRCKGKIITEDEIQRVIKNGKIIEFHFKDSRRIVVRGRSNEYGNNICVVLDIDKHEIITVWKNDVKDNHKTLDSSKYVSYINICGLLLN